MTANNKKLQVKLIRSLNGRLQNQKDCARGLGLRRLQQTVMVEDTPCNRGMINKINFLLQVEEAR